MLPNSSPGVPASDAVPGGRTQPGSWSFERDMAHSSVDSRSQCLPVDMHGVLPGRQDDENDRRLLRQGSRVARRSSLVARPAFLHYGSHIAATAIGLAS
jgi:hypothetical protein